MMKLVEGSSPKKKKSLQYICNKKGVCVCTFVYRGTRHVVETQRRIHVIHVLQKREKILHFFKRDALINTTEASGRWKNACLLSNEA